MKKERTVTAYKNYFLDFINSLQEEEAKKVFYVIDILKTQERVNTKFVKYLRNELYETSIQIITPKEHDYCEFHTP